MMPSETLALLCALPHGMDESSLSQLCSDVLLWGSGYLSVDSDGKVTCVPYAEVTINPSDIKETGGTL